MMKYLSLHLHTIKSIGDSIVTIDRLINKAKELGLNALSQQDCAPSSGSR